MAKYSGSYDDLIRGVSQQIPHDRREGQHTDQVNMISDPVRGLCRRHGSVMEHEYDIGSINPSFIDDTLNDARKYRSFDFVVDDNDMSSNTVEGIWTERISVIVEDVPAETIQAFHDNPHKTKFFYGVIKNVKSNISADTHELWLDAKTVIPYDGFMSSNNCLISGDMIDDLGGEDCVYCEDADSLS